MADRINLKRITHHLWKHWVRPIGLVVIVLGTFRAAVADWNDVPSGSMNPTILVGDRIVVNKLAFGLRVPLTHTWITQWGGPARGDVVICHASPNDKRLVKRVIGLPGDVVELRNNIVLINGSPAAYTPLEQATIDVIDPKQRPRHQFARESLGPESHPIMVTPRIKSRRDFGPVVVPADQYFVMGDNRDMSRDSRAFGFVDRHLISGRAFGVAFSLDYDHWYRPRFDRFFRKLP
jgi:signal peptidase I